uniref:Tetratricopeptide repeat-containing protein n=1 Tax=Candidatus Kentrum sp. DK TaxID=2126562 RepID=A0A450TLX7_9GAMM|nr:MAG: hypothetical protein BECKDK2373B_GA0170837_12212 [Candidatus Kentron sp. DK]
MGLCMRGIPAFGRLRQCAVTPYATQIPTAHTYSTLLLLGLLYDDLLGRTEEAVAFFRQAADKYTGIGDLAGEGAARSNVAITLHRLGRLAAARRECRRAIECKAGQGLDAEPWTSWAILAAIEGDDGNLAASRDAKEKAVALYLAYRRDGGENHFPQGRVALAVDRMLAAGEAKAAASFLEALLPRFEAAGVGGFIRALQRIVAGSREPILAEDPALDFSMIVEIRLLLERLG